MSQINGLAARTICLGNSETALATQSTRDTLDRPSPRWRFEREGRIGERRRVTASHSRGRVSRRPQTENWVRSDGPGIRLLERVRAEFFLFLSGLVLPKI